jgi:predicted dithiol-disulfide oxidoreductase (DUF899 family)
MTGHQVVSREDWQATRAQLLEADKEHMRVRPVAVSRTTDCPDFAD